MLGISLVSAMVVTAFWSWKGDLLNIRARLHCLLLDASFLKTFASIDPASVGVIFPKEVVKLKYYNYTIDPFWSYEAVTYTSPFSLVASTSKKNTSHLSTMREGQAQFKLYVSRAYDYKCCISGEKTPELLQAAHIQAYISKESNHIQNGLLLRIDLHKMYDSGLLTIDESYRVHISKKITSPDYTMFDGIRISLPTDASKHPSKDAIKEKMKEFRH